MKTRRGSEIEEHQNGRITDTGKGEKNNPPGVKTREKKKSSRMKEKQMREKLKRKEK